MSIIIGLIAKIMWCTNRALTTTTTFPFNERDTNSHSDQGGVEVQSPPIVNDSVTTAQHGDFSTVVNEVYGVRPVPICTSSNIAYSAILTVPNSSKKCQVTMMLLQQEQGPQLMPLR